MQDMTGRTSNFTAVAHEYDSTRHMPEAILSRCYDLLIAEGILPSSGLLLDAGCGTGQVSGPLAKRGIDIVGIDVSDAMIEVAAAKVEGCRRARYEIGDVRSLRFDDGTFDGVLFSKLLMHVEHWQMACRELVRVSKPGSSIVQIKDRGFFGNSVRREFSRRADALGFRSRFLGTSSSSNELPIYMANLGCKIQTFDDESLKWNHSITRREALEGFRKRLFAEFWYLPIPVYDRLLHDTSEWADREPGGFDAEEHLEPRLVVEVYRT